MLWMTEGMMSGRHSIPALRNRRTRRTYAVQVTQHYRDLLGGTALDVTTTIEHGSAAARQLLLARAKLRPETRTPFGELLKEITGKRNVSQSPASAEWLPDPALRRIGWGCSC